MRTPVQRALRRAGLLLLAAALPAAASAQANPAGHVDLRVQAVERTVPVLLDGKLDEAVWSSPAPATAFTQQDPDEGKPATQRTEVRFAYDAEALYIGARMFDTLGAAGVRTRLARRDQDVEGDWLELVFDTYHDHAGRTVFHVNPSGVKFDAGQASPNADPSWDPVWEASTRIDSVGWTAEMRIPFSQLRFSPDTAQTWGVQVWRMVERLQEVSMWSFWGKQDVGGPAKFGHLEGLRIASRPRGLEVLPYVVGRASYVTPTDRDNPFLDGSELAGRAGVDVRALLGSNLTLSATLNPDFGQVEVDPAVVNLSAFETFFEEKRPFFVEGSGLLGFGSFSCFTCSNVSSMSLFYSRRIGRRPQGRFPFDRQYADVPDNSAILGAAKLTGRLGGGLEIAVLDAVTRSETAHLIDGEGDRIQREMEPMSNYFVGRVRKTMNGGNLTVGAIATSLYRAFDYDSLRQQMSSHAEGAGVDWNVYWKDRTYRLMGNVAFSSVSGDSLAIQRLQRSSARYFQRPDREGGSNGLFSDAYDGGATSMRGYGGYLRMAKEGGPWRWEGQVNYRSPGFEVNDVAFLTRADYVWMLANVNRRWTTPNRWFRYLGITAGAQQQFNFDGDLNDRQYHLSIYSDLPNYWGVGTYLQHRPEVWDDRNTRGGVLVRRPASYYAGVNLATDGRKPVVVSTNPGHYWTAEGGYETFANLDVRFKPSSNVTLSVGPTYLHRLSTAQFVDRFDDPSATQFFGQRAVFAALEQTEVGMSTRIAWTFTPTLSLEVYAQPLVSVGDYRSFREYAAPRTWRKHVFDAQQLSRNADGGYTLDPDRNAATENFDFGDPDFHIRSLRGNAVVRWEWRPGSTLFFVWQQDRAGSGRAGEFDTWRDAPGAFRERPDNVFVVKASWWLGL
jgi:hypothetical protein